VASKWRARRIIKAPLCWHRQEEEVSGVEEDQQEKLGATSVT
jgi:hypothetical protein